MSDRWLVWIGTVCGLAAVVCLTIFFLVRGEIMAKGKAGKLIETACGQIAAKDYDGAIKTCADLQPLSPAEAHRIRGEAYERTGRLTEAVVEYQASYANGNHVAGASMERVRRKVAK